MTDSLHTQSPRADVILPCLNEAAALPRVLAGIPYGWRAIVVDNGSTDGSADLARSLGATVVHEPRRGFGAACHAGLLAAEAEFVCFCDCDGSLDPGLLPGFVRRIADEDTDLLLVAAPRGPRRLAPARPRGEPGARPHAAPPDGPAPARPRSDAGRAPGGPAGTGPHRPAQRLPAADGGTRVGRRAAGRGDGCPVSPAHRQIQGDRHLAGNVAGGTRHARRPARAAGTDLGTGGTPGAPR